MRKIKLLSALLCLVLVAGSCIHPAVAKLQDPLVKQYESNYELPPIDFTMKDVLDVLTEYTIRNEDRSWACTYQVYAYTDFRTKTITLCSGYDLGDRRNSIIHEILHVLYHYRGIDTAGPYEFAIGHKATEIANELYGFPKSDTAAPTSPAAPPSASEETH